MFRRTNGRPPPLLLGGLILFIIILSYSYWTLNTQNNDVLQSVEKLQANMKIGEVKIEQSERKMSALQDLLHEKEEAIKRSENKLLQQEDNIKTYNSDLKKRDYEITTLKNDIIKLQEKVQTLEDKIMECEGDNEKMLKENDLLMSQRDDAITALAKRDDQISELSRKLDQERVRNRQLDANMSALTRELALAQTRLVDAQGAGAPHENSALGHHQAQAHDVSSRSSPLLGPGQLRAVQQPLSVKAVDKGLQGLHFHGAPVLLRDAPDAPRPRPRFSVLDDIAVGDGAAAGVAAPPQPPDRDQVEGVLPQPLKDSAERQSPLDVGPGDTGHQPPRDVLPQPPGFQDNLDAAVDEVARPGEEDPLLPDQDPGGEVAHQEQRLQDPRLHQHSVHDGGDGRLDHFGGGDEDEGGAAGANNQDFVDDGGNLVGGRGIDSPLIAANRDDNEGGEVETGDQQPAPADQELLENGAKENFFGDDPPLRLRINGNNDNVLANDKQNSLDDNMVLQ